MTPTLLTFLRFLAWGLFALCLAVSLALGVDRALDAETSRPLRPLWPWVVGVLLSAAGLLAMWGAR